MISLQKGVYTPSGEVSVYVYSEQYTQYIIYKYIDIEYIYIYMYMNMKHLSIFFVLAVSLFGQPG